MAAHNHRFSSNTSQRNRLFADYDGSRQHSQSPTGRPNAYGSSPYTNSGTPPSGAFGAYPGANGHAGQFRSATPNSRGQYSDAVLSELESQNDEQVAGLSGKVKRLKDVSPVISN